VVSGTSTTRLNLGLTPVNVDIYFRLRKTIIRSLKIEILNQMELFNTFIDAIVIGLLVYIVLTLNDIQKHIK
jgi:hypothetical protein